MTQDDKDEAFMERIKLVLETVAKEGLPGPRDLDVAIESIYADAQIWRGDFEVDPAIYAMTLELPPGETGPENSREEMSPVLNGTLDASVAQLAAAKTGAVQRLQATILRLEAALDQRNEALLAIKGLCAGEGHPKWSNKGAITVTRGKIMDIVDVTLRTWEKPDAV